MKKYSSAVLALILTSTCMTASAATQEISKKAYFCDGNKTMEVVYINTTAGKPTQNAFIERFNRTYRTEILDFYLFRTLNEVREITEQWLSEYNCERPHESLNNLTPEEYRQQHYQPGISKSVWN
ncbi:hypothetical protein FGAF1053_47580 (plasmid) [Escherichia coli]|uniref:Integrase catalytic domain-containing protein n=1 Tax=Escherichia coli TaxID=562 RepID=A0AAV1ISW9_ECOLX|nr:hypothetical protein FGAS161_47570 [Escherichia coli]CAK1261968.1 hypothetical protein FGAF1253_47770 [Escherichia coli]CAK1353972.1 hypothetical protein FGAF1053_47580 [Escherichia coli]CAK5261700.1 hypothetical protein FGAF524_46410 [Escherichia coli]HAV9887520.1 transposase [Escherichia coli]